MFETIAPVVFARGGSKGIPQKNLAILGGKTLLRRSIEHGLAAGFSTVFVSTDSEEIAEEAESAGGTVPFLRPSELASDESPEWHSWQHFSSFLADGYPGQFTHLLVLPTTAPLRSQEDLDAVLNLIISGAWDILPTGIPCSIWFVRVQNARFPFMMGRPPRCRAGRMWNLSTTSRLLPTGLLLTLWWEPQICGKVELQESLFRTSGRLI
jgi:CMP-N-acetylneuraminic acid synthetase